MSTLTDYFPSVLAQEINAAAYIKPIIIAVYNEIYALKSTGEVVIRDEDEDYVPLSSNLPKMKYLNWSNSFVVMITIDSKAMWIYDDVPTIISQLEQYDIIQITCDRNMLYALTVTGQLISFGLSGLRFLDTNIVQIKFAQALNLEGQVGQVYDLKGTKHLQPDVFVTDILSTVDYSTLDGMITSLKNKNKISDVIQYIWLMESNWRFYLTEKGKIFVNKPANTIPYLTNISSFDLLNEFIVTIDTDNNILMTPYTTKKRLFIGPVSVADEDDIE